MNTKTEDPQVPRLRTFVFTMIWMLPLAALLFIAVFRLHVFSHSTYIGARFALIVLMLCFAVAGLLRAFDLVGTNTGKPWFTDALLITLVVFWGLFPPMWFFVEYLSFDRGSIALPQELVDLIAAAETDKRKEVAEKQTATFLSSTKLYAEMSAKVWAAVGTVLAGIIALVKRP